MKGLLGFGKPGRQRFSMQYGYSARHSWWQEVKAHAHLVIAAVGTMALLAVAAVALWLATSPGERQAFAEAKADPQPVIAAEAPKAPVNAPAVVAKPVQSQQEPPPAAVEQPEIALSQPKVPELDPQAAAAVAAPAVESAEPVPAETKNAAPAADQDGAMTAAIPTPRPTPPSETKSAEAKPTESKAAGDKTSGHILRGVTMRSGPKTGAAAIGTIPAKTAVEVISCEKWCEIVYKGKRGFVYKSFLQRD